MTKPKVPAECPEPGCTNRRLPGKGKRYCKEHSTPQALSERRKAAYREKNPIARRPAAKAPDTISTALNNLRQKERPGSKADEGKLQADLILGDFPRALEAIIRVGQHGNATKYEPGSWLKLPNGPQRVRNAAFRHWLNEKKGLVRAELQGRGYVYTALYTRDASTASFLDRVFDGAATQLVQSLLRSDDISDTDLARMETLISETRARRQGGEAS